MRFTKKYFAFIFLIVLLLFPIHAFALEAIYPKLPWLPAITIASGISVYVSYFFGLAIIIAGFIALVSFTIGAVTYIISAGNPSTIGEAKDRMTGALIGLVLLLTSFLIMQTINPAITQTTVGSLPIVDGVYYYKSDKEMLPAQMTVSDDSSALNAGYESIFYRCSTGNDLIIWKYPKKDFDLPKVDTEYGQALDYSKVLVETISCGQKTSISSALSFKLAYKTAGVYYFLGANCSGFMSGATTASNNSLPEPFNGRVKSVKIINNNSSYAVLFHQYNNMSGGCMEPIFETGCTEVSEKSYEELMSKRSSFSSSTIFQINKDYVSSGDGITFYSWPYGYKAGAKSGAVAVKKNDAQFAKYYWEKDAVNISFKYPASVLAAEKIKCSNFSKCPGSIEIKGSYLVLLLASKEDSDSDETYTYGDDICCSNGTCTGVSATKKNCAYAVAGGTYFGGECNTNTDCANGPDGCIDCGPGGGLDEEEVTYSQCQVFTKTAPNLKWEEFIALNYPLLKVQIWPTK